MSLVQSCFGVGSLPKCLFDFFKRYWSLIKNGVSSIDLTKKSKNIISKIMHSFLLSYTSLFNGFGNRFKNEDMLLIYEWGLKNSDSWGKEL